MQLVQKIQADPCISERTKLYFKGSHIVWSLCHLCRKSDEVASEEDWYVIYVGDMLGNDKMSTENAVLPRQFDNTINFKVCNRCNGNSSHSFSRSMTMEILPTLITFAFDQLYIANSTIYTSNKECDFPLKLSSESFQLMMKSTKPYGKIYLPSLFRKRHQRGAPSSAEVTSLP